MLVALVGVVVVYGLQPGIASAHDDGGTTLLITEIAERSTLTMEARVPLATVEFGFDLESALTDAPESVVADYGDMLRQAYADGVHVTGDDGRPWAVSVVDLSVDTADGAPKLVVDLRAAIPADQPEDPSNVGVNVGATLEYGVLNARILNHNVYVALAATDANEDATLVGTINNTKRTVHLAFASAATSAASSNDAVPSAVPVGGGASTPIDGGPSIVDMIGLGWQHFRVGTDHLLFVTVLTLGALVQGDRRAAPPDASIASPSRSSVRRRTARNLIWLTMAFSVGHSISLALAASGLVRLPGAVVESAIAATIALTAAVVIAGFGGVRIGLRQEVVATLVFGLIHGFGFAGTMSDLGLGGVSLLGPTLGFNIGLELAQLAAIGLLVVPLWLIARSAARGVALAAAVFIVAGMWFLQRSIAWPNPLEPLVARVAASPERLAASLLAASLFLIGVGVLNRRCSRETGSRHSNGVGASL